MQKVIAKIHLNAIRQNALLWKKRTGVKLCAVVKADGYGHGGEEVALTLSDIADLFAVALIEEGLTLRAAACGRDILVFTPPQTEEEAYALLVNGFLVTLPDLYTAKLLIRTCRKYNLTARVHLKVNTGMNRYGMNDRMLGRVCKLLKASPWVRVEGLYSHLYRCDEKTALAQRELFLRMQGICKRYFSSFISHLGATYGAQLGKKFAFDMVRVGIGLYGYTPLGEDSELQRAMELSTRVVCNRKYAFGGVGYGDERAERGERLAVCRVGYADGVLRTRKNGTIGDSENANELCMDVCIRRGKQRRGREIPLLVNAEETAVATGTIPYEVLCAATRRAERIYD